MNALHWETLCFHWTDDLQDKVSFLLVVLQLQSLDLWRRLSKRWLHQFHQHGSVWSVKRAWLWTVTGMHFQESKPCSGCRRQSSPLMLKVEPCCLVELTWTDTNMLKRPAFFGDASNPRCTLRFAVQVRRRRRKEKQLKELFFWPRRRLQAGNEQRWFVYRHCNLVVQNFDNFFKMSNLSTLRVLIHDTLAMPKFGTCALSETCSVSVEVQHGTSPLHAQEKLWKGMWPKDAWWGESLWDFVAM